MLVLTILCLLFAYHGFRFWMFLAQSLDDAEQWLENYLDGFGVLYLPEVWR